MGRIGKKERLSMRKATSLCFLLALTLVLGAGCSKNVKEDANGCGAEATAEGCGEGCAEGCGDACKTDACAACGDGCGDKACGCGDACGGCGCGDKACGCGVACVV